ncbi:MAG: response regulator [Candidatus Kapaibacteriales bacterium]
MKKIVIIDDDPDIVESVSLLLTSRNFQVVSARYIEEGEELIMKENPDLILLDVMMQEPDDGFYLAAKIRKKGITTPIFLLTSVSKASGLEFAVGDNLQVNEFLEKPISSSTLEELITKYLGK